MIKEELWHEVFMKSLEHESGWGARLDLAEAVRLRLLRLDPDAEGFYEFLSSIMWVNFGPPSEDVRKIGAEVAARLNLVVDSGE